MRRCLFTIGLTALLSLSAVAETPKPDQQALIESLVKDLFLAGERSDSDWRIPEGKLAQIGPAVIPVLVNQVRSTGTSGYSMVTRGSETIRLMGVQALPVITEILEKNPHQPRAINRCDLDMLRRAMARLGRDALPFVARLMKSESSGVRLNALCIYADFGPAVPEGLDAMSAALKSNDTDIRRQALISMQDFGRAALPALLAGVKPEETDLLKDVIGYLSSVRDKELLPPEVLPYVKTYIKDNLVNTYHARCVLERIGLPARELLPQLMQCLPSADKEQFNNYLRDAIASVNANDGGLEGAIAEGLAHADPTVRSWCLEYLKDHATKTEALREAVRKVEAQQGDRPTDETVKAMELLKEPTEKQ
ncbi:MAG: hypothetical protein L6R28_04765 [Planctomycetes bacterium]|nr:hypothetical protein [Planctomycetota bacterium]